MFGRKSSEPKLTKLARQLSQQIEALDAVGKANAVATISSLVSGIKNLSTMPENVIDTLWESLLAVGTKFGMGQQPDAIFNDIIDGLSPGLFKTIEREAKK